MVSDTPVAERSATDLKTGSAVRLRCQTLDGSAPGVRRGEPVSCGVPWARGMLLDTRQLALVDEHGVLRPLQARALDRWPDGSVRWTLLDWLANPSATPQVGIMARALPRPATALGVTRTRDGQSLTVSTGTARFRMRKGSCFPFDAVHVGAQSGLDPSRTRLVVEDHLGRTYTSQVSEITIAEAGPVRVHTRLAGCLTARDDTLLHFRASLHFFAASATVRLDLTLTNPRRAGHPGGIWTLGQKGAVYLRDANLTLTLPRQEGEAPAIVRCSPERESPAEIVSAPLELYQDSSGGEHWQSPNHLNRHREVPTTFRGYRLKAGAEERRGLRATPMLWLERGPRRLGLAMPHFWQNFPKALEATETGLTLRLFPRQYADEHEIQGGEQKTHAIYVAFDRDGVTDEPLAWCRSPLMAHVDPEHYADAAAVPHLLPRAQNPHRAYDELVALAIEGEDRFEQKRELVDEYGWRNFGDLHADHENAYYDGPKPVISHYNNQYDAIQGFAIQFMRSGDPRWFRAMDELARHVIDIDIYHTDADRAAYNHGLFWHTDHYLSADTSTHRSYPLLPGVNGGGPSPGHLYTTGLVLHHFLTGNHSSRGAVLELGRYVIDADDGTKTLFRVIDRGPTGHISTSGYDDYHGPGRTPGNALNALVDAHRLSNDVRFMEKAEALIRRCIHPADDLERRALHDKENRWFYTIFLCGLGKYLEHKAEHEDLDWMYAYARSALLHYARWAAEHEHPYLDKPEILEFPTETWAAQDMRKFDMFHHAARHAQGPDAARFLERARFFFDDALERLAEMPTRTYCRPLVLILGHGYGRAHIERHPLAPAPEPAVKLTHFGQPRSFVSQKKRVKRRLGYAAALALVLAFGAMLWP